MRRTFLLDLGTGFAKDAYPWTALSTLGLIAPAYADAIFTPGSSSYPDEQVVIFQAPQMGTTIDGHLTDTLVQFSSTDTLTTSGANSPNIGGNHSDRHKNWLYRAEPVSGTMGALRQ